MDTDIVVVQVLEDVEEPSKAVRVLAVVGSVFAEFVVVVVVSDTGEHRFVMEDEDSVILD